MLNDNKHYIVTIYILILHYDLDIVTDKRFVCLFSVGINQDNIFFHLKVKFTSGKINHLGTRLIGFYRLKLALIKCLCILLSKYLVISPT